MTGSTTPRPAGSGVRLVAVGDLYPPDLAADGADPSDIAYLAFDEVSTQALEELRPDVVLTPLVDAGFDCLDLAERLVAAGYRGKLRAVAPTVPDPALVRREIADRFPQLDFDLVVLDGLG